MTDKTLELIETVLSADRTVRPSTRSRILAILVGNGNEPTATPPAPPDPTRLIRRREASLRLGLSVRTVDLLAAQGALEKVRLPGRRRACGFRASDVSRLIEQGGTP